jgi:hypothetical protein
MNVPSLLQSWMVAKVEWLLSLLEDDVQRGSGGARAAPGDVAVSSTTSSTRLDSLLNHTLYFGLSFGRIGADFRLLAVPIFEKALVEQFRRLVQPATAK